MVDGRIYHGLIPGEAEIGHLRLDRQGTIVEARCSGWSVDARIRALTAADPTSLLAHLAAETPGPEAARLAAALAQGDPPARQILLDLGEDLGFALSHVIHLVHPQVIILGGGLSGIGEPLRHAVATAVGRFLMDAFAPGPGIRLAALGPDAVPVGALVLAREACI